MHNDALGKEINPGDVVFSKGFNVAHTITETLVNGEKSDCFIKMNDVDVPVDVMTVMHKERELYYGNIAKSISFINRFKNNLTTRSVILTCVNADDPSLQVDDICNIDIHIVDVPSDQKNSNGVSDARRKVQNYTSTLPNQTKLTNYHSGRFLFKTKARIMLNGEYRGDGLRYSWSYGSSNIAPNAPIEERIAISYGYSPPSAKLCIFSNKAFNQFDIQNTKQVSKGHEILRLSQSEFKDFIKQHNIINQ